MSNKVYGGIAQFFYHCKGQVLPIRDILNTNGKGNKTEPHYENLTENWYNPCMNKRIRSINHNELDYLFLFTKYFNQQHSYNHKYLIVGYYKRATAKRFFNLSKSMKSGAEPYDLRNPKNCGFFAGDPKDSIFVSADDAYIIKIKHPYYYWYVETKEAEKIINHFQRCENILPKLLDETSRLKKEISKNENCFTSCRN